MNNDGSGSYGWMKPLEFGRPFFSIASEKDDAY